MGAKTRTGVVERLIRTFKKWIGMHLKKYSDEEEDELHRDWVSYVPELLHFYNYEHVHRSVGMPPADVGEEGEKDYLASQLFRHERVDKHWQDVMRENAGHNDYVRVLVPRENKEHRFWKEGRDGIWSSVKYTLPRPYGARPSLVVSKIKRDGSRVQEIRRPMPYTLKWGHEA